MKIPDSYSREARAEANFYRLGGYAFQEMKKYLTDVEGFFRSKRINSNTYYKDQLETYPEWFEMITSVAQREHVELDIRLPNILYGSAFAASFSILEVIFKKVCVLAAYKYSQPLPEAIMFGTIDDCRSFMTKKLRVDFSLVGNHWKNLLKYRTLRNDIVHHNSVIAKETAGVIPFLKDLEYIKVRKVRNKEHYVFTIQDRRFIFDFLDCATQFIANILLALPKGKRKSLPRYKST